MPNSDSLKFEQSIAILGTGNIGQAIAEGIVNSGEYEPEQLILKKLIESKQLKPVIDRVYSLDKIVEAHRYVDTGHKRGNVIIKVSA